MFSPTTMEPQNNHHQSTTVHKVAVNNPFDVVGGQVIYYDQFPSQQSTINTQPQSHPINISIVNQSNSIIKNKSDQRNGKFKQSWVQRFITYMTSYYWLKNLKQTLDSVVKYMQKLIKKKNPQANAKNFQRGKILKEFIEQIDQHENQLADKLKIDVEKMDLIRQQFTNPAEQEFIEELFERIRIKFFLIMFKVQMRKHSPQNHKEKQDDEDQKQKSVSKITSKFLDSQGNDQIHAAFDQEFLSLKTHFTSQNKPIQNYDSLNQNIKKIVMTVSKQKTIKHKIQEQSTNLIQDDDDEDYLLSDEIGKQIKDSRNIESQSDESQSQNDFQDEDEVQSSESQVQSSESEDNNLVEENQTQTFDSCIDQKEDNDQIYQEKQNSKSQNPLIIQIIEKTSQIAIFEPNQTLKENENTQSVQIVQNSQQENDTQQSNPEMNNEKQLPADSDKEKPSQIDKLNEASPESKLLQPQSKPQLQ